MSIRFVSVQGTYNQLSVALFQDQKCLDSITKTDSHASSNLIPFLDSILKNNNLSLSDLSFIAVDKGPGAFTSLRVTIATINGIAFSNKIPLIGINGLEALTRQVLASNENIPNNIQNIVTLLNAYNNDAYFLVSKIANQIENSTPETQNPESQLVGSQNIAESQNIGCQNIDILLEDLKLKFKDQSVLFCGQGSQLYKTNIKHEFSDQSDFALPSSSRLRRTRRATTDKAVILEEPLLACAKTIGQMGYKFWLKKENIENQIEPLYLKTQYFAIRK
jgi:tRNA threonylcarbamoyladenosine biosynthesis protein TsaB